MNKENLIYNSLYFCYVMNVVNLVVFELTFNHKNESKVNRINLFPYLLIKRI